MFRTTSPDVQCKIKTRSNSNPPSTFHSPRVSRRSMKTLIKKQFCFNKNKNAEKCEDDPSRPSYLGKKCLTQLKYFFSFQGQIYKNVKIKISRSFTKSTNSSQVRFEFYFHLSDYFWLQENSSIWSRSFTSQSSKDSVGKLQVRKDEWITISINK